MPVQHTKASAQVRQLFSEVQALHHPHLEQAVLALEFVDNKPFVKGRLNLGRVTKFNAGTKLWFPDNTKYDFLISMCADVWFGMMNEQQRVAYADLLLSRCKVEYEPNTIVENGKKRVVKDEFGRIDYTDVIKTDDEGRPVWKVVPADLAVCVENVRRYGIWYDVLLELKQAIEDHNEDDKGLA